MEARAELRQVRISPRKVGIVLDLIRNKPVEIAFATLKNTPKIGRARDSTPVTTKTRMPSSA